MDKMHKAKEKIKEHYEKMKEKEEKKEPKKKEKKHKASSEDKPKKWIAGAIKHPGALHKDLGVPMGKKIPMKKIKAAESKGGVEGKRAHLAETLKKMHKGK